MKTKSLNIVMIGFIAFMLQSCTHDIYVDPQASEKEAYASADAINGAKLFSNFQHVDAGWGLVTPADATANPALANLVGWPNPKYAADPTLTEAEIKAMATYTAQTGVTTPSPAPQANRNFYSCSSCHPVDGMGREGAGISKKTAANQPQLATNKLIDCKSWDPKVLFDAIKNVGGRQIDATKTANGLDLTLGGQTHPDYSRILTDEKIWDLVKWLKEGIFNENNDLYTLTTHNGPYQTVQATPIGSAPYVTYANIGSDGDAAAGVAFYAQKCSYCHGVDGHGTTNAQGPIMPTGVVNQTNGAGSANPATASGTTAAAKLYGLGSFFRYNTANAAFTVITGKFGNVPWMAATPITKKEMKDLIAAFNGPSGLARFPDFTTQLPNP
ncbi:MAG: hypothetical protein RIQ59_768 [Bacteroidota bacterium]|jgi:mono/diheme cytochrome c family protein